MQEKKFGTICVLGLGYIGLPTASVIASHGLQVIGVDTKLAVVDSVNLGEIHIVEPDLELVTSKAVAQGKLRAATAPEAADAFVIAVPTPFHDNKADLSYVDAAGCAIAPVLKKGNLVVLESTCPPGATERFVGQLAALRPDLRFPRPDHPDCDYDVFVAYCPERVLPGRVLTELVENSRVIGGVASRCSKIAVEFYRIFCTGKLLSTSARTAEMCKLTENAFRDVNIAFANELSAICDRLGISVWELIRLANHHPRVNILRPGPGVGGHCIAVDPWFIVEAAPEQAQLIRTAREVNDRKPQLVLEKIREAIDDAFENRKQPVIALLGLAFKPDVDDLRESPALQIAEEIANWNNVSVVVSEPNIKELPPTLQGRPNLHFETDTHTALAKSSVVVMLVDHSSYGEINLLELDDKLLIDTRGMWS